MSLTFGKRVQNLPQWEDTQTNRRNYANMAGDPLGGIFLSRLVYWHEDAKAGKRAGESRLRVRKNGHLWLARANGDWFDETAITGDQIEQLLKTLHLRGVVEYHQWLFDNKPINHIRIVEEVFWPLWAFCLEHPPSPQTFKQSKAGKAAREQWWAMAKNAIAKWQKTPSRDGEKPDDAMAPDADATTPDTPSGTSSVTPPMGAGAPDVVLEEENSSFDEEAVTPLVEKVLGLAQRSKSKLQPTREEVLTIVRSWPAAHLSHDGLYEALTTRHAEFGLDGAIEGKVDPARHLIDYNPLHVRFMLCVWRHFDQSKDEWQAEQRAKGRSLTKTACFITQTRKLAEPPERWLEIELGALRKEQQKRERAVNSARAEQRQREYMGIRKGLTSAQEDKLREMMVDEHRLLHPSDDKFGQLHNYSDPYAHHLATRILLDPEKCAVVLCAVEEETSPFDDEVEEIEVPVGEPSGPGEQLDLEVEVPQQLVDVNAELEIPERGLPFHLVRPASTLKLSAEADEIASVQELDAAVKVLPLDGQDRARVRGYVLEQVPQLPPRWEPKSVRLEKLERFAQTMLKELMEARPLEWVDEELSRFTSSSRERRWTAERIMELVAESGGDLSAQAA